MSLPSSTLSAIQKAGAAVFTADEKLKKAVKACAERVHAAIAANPYDPQNDRLMEDWKTAARLSQTFARIEAEIQKAFQIAAKMNDADQPGGVPSPVIAAPARAAATLKTATKKARQTSKPVKRAPTGASESSLTAPIDWSPTEALVKPKKTPSKSGTGASQSTGGAIVAAAAKTAQAVKPLKAGKVAQVASMPTSSQVLSGNPAKLLGHLASLLNSNDFTTFSQTAASRETGIPLGSMTAATKKLLEMGRLTAGPAGSFKLAKMPRPVAP